MRRILQVVAAVTAMMVATAAQTPAAKAGVDECTYIAQKICKGTQDPNGNFYYPGGPGWLACVEDQKQYILICQGPPPTPCREPSRC